MRYQEIFDTPTPPALAPSPVIIDATADHDRRYALAALASETQTLSQAVPGTRNDRLNTAAFSLAQLIPHITETEIVDTLTATALAIGLTASETKATIASGVRKGRLQPRTIPAPSFDSPNVVEVAWPTDSTIDDFWDARPVLRHIHDFAHWRLTSPWAVLGNCLLRAVCAVPPHVVTPPIIGGVGSLNLLMAAVGPSGAGKGASEAAAADALTWPAQVTAPLGSGEGITHAYARHRTKTDDPSEDPLTWTTHSVLFSSPEIDQVAAIGSRKGSTLMPQLRSAYSGERLGMQYADSSRRVILPAHSYRFGLSVGVQPDRASALLDDADGGTPQRFIWMPVTDPTIGATTVQDDMRPWSWTRPLIHSGLSADVRRDLSGREVVQVPQLVVDTIREAHIARARGQGDALDGHSLFTRLKVAHGLAFLDQRPTIDTTDWELAGIVMSVSDATRASVQARLSASAQQADDARAMREARRQVVTEQAVADAAIRRVSRRIAAHVQRAGEMTRGQARRGVAFRDRGVFEDALASLVEQGLIQIVESNGSEVLRWLA